MLKVEQVSKKYGKKTVLNKISFELEKGNCFGLLGSNGAGKSTIIRIILGILSKNEGKVTYNNKEVSRKNVNFGFPREFVNGSKIKKIQDVAQIYMMEKNLFGAKIRFDVIEIIFDNHKITHIENAF